MFCAHKRPGWWLVATVLVFGGWVAERAAAELEDQPDDKGSALVTHGGEAISDADFAEMMQGLLMPGGENNVRDAKFLFQQCFGGGMLDDLEDTFGTTVKWVGGSASKHDECSVGQVSTAENETEGYDDIWVFDPPIDWWTDELKDEMAEDQSLLDAINSANSQDQVGGGHEDPYGEYEHGQSVCANGGEEITLADPDAQSHHAILWGGNADHMRHFNDIQAVRNVLVDKWGDPGGNVTISVLFGDGEHASDGSDLPDEWNAQSATRENLEAVIANLTESMNENEQFFFYASDHGDSITVTVDEEEPEEVPPGDEHSDTFELNEGEMEGMESQDDNQPTIKVKQVGLTTTAPVIFNGVEVGVLDPNYETSIVDVPEQLVLAVNDLTIVNPGTQTMVLYRVEFSIGSIDTNPVRAPAAPIPAASPLGLAILAMLLLAGSMVVFRRRPARAA